MDSPTRYMVNPAVSHGDEQDGAVLFNPDTDDTAIVNLTGRALWDFMETPRTIDEIAAYLVETYQGVSADQATKDATQFVQSLVPDFLLEMNDHA
jgi:hypothetical protein